MMRVIITGGTGLIGRALAKSFIKDGYEVIVLSRHTTKATGLPPAVQLAQWDARTSQGWGHLVEGATAIINLAGAGVLGDGLLPAKWTPARKKLLQDSRRNAGIAVREAITQATNKPKLLIQSSAVGYYGTYDDDRVLTEVAPAGNDFLAHICTDHWENVMAGLAEEQGIRVVTTRIGIVLSTDGGALPSMALPFKFFVGGKLGSGKQWVSWVHMDDIVGAMKYLISHEKTSGVYNLTAPQPVTNQTLTQALGKVLGRPTLMPVPAFALRLTLGELATTLLEGQRVLPERLQEAGYSFQFNDIETALKDLYR